MRFEGKLIRDGRWWLAEVPLFDAMTQGRTRKEALLMIADWFEAMADRLGFTANVRSSGNAFEIGGSDTTAMIALLLLRQQQAIRASLTEIDSRQSFATRTAYARYERCEA